MLTLESISMAFGAVCSGTIDLSTDTGCQLRIAPPRVPPGFRLYGIYRREAIGFNLLDLTVSA